MKKTWMLLIPIAIISIVAIILTLLLWKREDKPSVIEQSVSKTFVSKSDSTFVMGYRIFVPQDYDAGKKYPVLLYLHGSDKCGSDNVSQTDAKIQHLFDTCPDILGQTIVISPQCPKDKQWVDYPCNEGNYSTDEVAESKTLATVYEIMENVLQEYSCDKDRVYVLGLSMGGYGAWDMITRHGDMFAAAVPLCGGGDPSKAEYLKDIPIWTYHSTNDSEVKFQGTSELYDAIVSAGGEKIRFSIIENAGHDVWTEANTNEELIKWLFSQKLSDRTPRA